MSAGTVTSLDTMYTFSADFVTPDSGSSARVAMVTIAGPCLAGMKLTSPRASLSFLW